MREDLGEPISEGVYAEGVCQREGVKREASEGWCVRGCVLEGVYRKVCIRGGVSEGVCAD